jgi:hypothetical protein
MVVSRIGRRSSFGPVAAFLFGPARTAGARQGLNPSRFAPMFAFQAL